MDPDQSMELVLREPPERVPVLLEFVVVGEARVQVGDPAQLLETDAVTVAVVLASNVTGTDEVRLPHTGVAVSGTGAGQTPKQ